MAFEVEIGCCSRAGLRSANEDFAAVRRPGRGDEERGLIAAVADGVSTGGGGMEAARTTVASLLLDYYAAPDTWDTTVVLDRLIGAQNGWLADHNRRRQGAASASMPGIVSMTTLTALVLRGHGFTLAHVGDTRAWLMRGGECVQLTADHAFDHPDLRNRLTRALGLDDRVRIDFLQAPLHPGDVLLLTSDGVHRALKPAHLARLACEGNAQAASEALAEAALDAGSRDNVSAIVLRVAALAEPGLHDALLEGRALPVPPVLKVGDRLDLYTVTGLIADNGIHRLYQAREEASRELVAIKTLHGSRAGDPEERAMLAHEVWLGQRVAATSGGPADRHAGGFVRVREAPAQSAFYAVYDWHPGRTLEQWLAEGRTFTVREVLDGALQITRALATLHRLGIVHRDLKPENLHLGEDGRWRILDLGVAVSGREPRALRTLHAGTPSYMNPEQWHRDEHVAADATSDLYALGVTLYRWLTKRLPYGEIEPYQLARYRRDPHPPSRLRPDIPVWLDHVILKAVALDKAQRFDTAEELLVAIERGAARPLNPIPATPLATRDPITLWKIAAALSILFNALLIYWLLFLPK